ncbi:MAG TPA: dienelactone hydrolase family protein, partial [Rubrobacter sp.]|nr:dienelactone hydrolase family protein [Rubrobacter sp.]
GAAAAFEAHTYPGLAHLFSDHEPPEYDRASSEAMWDRVLTFLDRRPRVGPRGYPIADPPLSSCLKANAAATR